jgi:hypothetical protein
VSDSLLTELDVRGLQDAQGDVDAALATWKDEIAARDERLRKYHARGAGVTELANAIGLHRSQVNRIITRQKRK